VLFRSILDGAPRILPNFPEDLSVKAERSLIRLGARVRTGVRVLSVDGEGVVFQTPAGPERLPSKTVLWAGGVTSSEFGKKLALRTKAETDRSGRIKVNPDLTIPQYPEIYVVGDMALAFRRDGTPLPGVAQVAMQQGSYAAEVIRRRLAGRQEAAPFRYFDQGDIAVIGRASAVANLFGIHVWGYTAWLVWLFIHLMYLVEFRSRLLVFIQWGFQYFTFSRGARLITGHETSDSLQARPAEAPTLSSSSTKSPPGST
jgi:NADH:ubiquinone reductase (H+-translocating)